MKTSITALLFLCSGLITTVASAEEKIQLADVGVMGGGEVIVYYRERDQIVIRSCGKDYPKIQKREDCKASAPTVKVHVDAFRQALENSFLMEDRYKLKPLHPQEVRDYVGANVDRAHTLKMQEQILAEKLKRIEAFIRAAGGTDAVSAKDRYDTGKQLVEVRKELLSQKKGLAATKKVNEIVKSIIDKISASQFTPVSSVRDSDTALYSVLKAFDPRKVECGTDDYVKGYKKRRKNSDPMEKDEEKGAVRAAWLLDAILPSATADKSISVSDRIRDCASFSTSTVKTSAGIVWHLVKRRRDSDGRLHEVWLDSDTGLLWGDGFGYGRYRSQSSAAAIAPHSGKVLSEAACESPEGKQITGEITDKKFGLPSEKEFKQAEMNGIREVTPTWFGYTYWTSTRLRGSGDPRLFNGYKGSVFSISEEIGIPFAAVRCVGRGK